MGQAKRRGSFEERKAAAIMRDSNKPKTEQPVVREANRTELHLRHAGFAPVLDAMKEMDHE